MGNTAVTGPVDKGANRYGGAMRKTPVIVAILFLAAMSMRLIDIGGRSLWVDEGATAINSRQDLDRILAGEANHVEHPPGYYALIHLTSVISDSEAGLRIPSALVSALSVIVTYSLGRRLVDHRFGLTAAAILLLAPLDLWYAQEARQPVFAAAAVTGALWGLTRRGRLGYPIAVMALLVGLYIDYITAAGWVAVGAIWVVVWLKRDRARVLDWLLVSGLAFLIYAPIRGREFVEGFRTLLDYDGAGLWYGSVLGSNPVTANAFGLLLVAAILAALTIILGNRLTKSVRWGSHWSIALVVGFALISVLTVIPRAYSVKKVLVVGWPVLTLIVAYLIINRLGDRWRRPVAVGLLAASALACGVSLLIPKDDWRGAVSYINATATSGDVAWTRDDPWAADAYLYYGGSLPVFLEAEPSGADLPANGEVWLITYRRPQDVAPSLAVEEWFDQNWRLVEEVLFYRLAIRHYAR